MTKTFKVGDKVRAIDNNYGITTLDYGFEGVVAHVRPNGTLSIKQTKPVDGNVGYEWGGLSAEHFELLDATPTKKQRIQTLESEVEALKQRVDELEKARSTKLSDVTVNVKCEDDIAKIAEELTAKLLPKTPNQRRKAVIERAKDFVANVEGMANSYRGDTITVRKHTLFKNHDTLVTIPEYHVNKEKRVVTVLVKGANYPRLYGKAIAKCAPGDVFNVHIGKAIALAKAYGINCPDEFLNAPQPEIAVGQRIKATPVSPYGKGERVVYAIEGDDVYTHPSRNGWFTKEYTIVLDDSEAQYDA